MNAVSPPDALLVVDHLRRTFDVSAPLVTRMVTRQGRRLLKAVDDVSFTVRAGQTLCLVGESGCGKSTVARCVSGLMSASGGAVTWRGTPVEAISRGRHPWRHEIQMVFQDPYGSLNPRWRVGRIVADPIRALKLASTRREIEAAVTRHLESVGLSAADAQKYPHEFSGGQRQRIAIARALASRPALVICDEPTSALDVSVQAQILNLMKDLQDGLGLTYLFISHNLAVVEHMADHVGVMYLGRIVEISDKESLFRAPRHPYTQALIRAMPRLDEIGVLNEPMPGETPNPIEPPAGCAFHPRCPFATPLCREERPPLRVFAGGEVACHHAGALA